MSVMEAARGIPVVGRPCVELHWFVWKETRGAKSLPLVILESVCSNVALHSVLGKTLLAVPRIFPLGGTASQPQQEYRLGVTR